METQGQAATTKVLSNEEFGQALRKKLIEEARELEKAKNKTALVEELADVLEIIGTILEIENLSQSEIERVRLEKRKKHGGFKQKIFLSILF